jgi:hypothetical protein
MMEEIMKRGINGRSNDRRELVKETKEKSKEEITKGRENY